MLTQNIKLIQDRLLEMAKAITHILENNNIPYFLAWGSLLGAVRHKGFIPWDDDFDLYLFSDTYDKAIELLRNELPNDMFVEDEKSEPLYFHGWAHVKDINSQTTCELFPQDGVYAHKGISIDLYKTTKVKESQEKIFLTEEHISYLNRRYSKGLIDILEYTERINKLEAQLKELKETVEKTEYDNEIYACPPQGSNNEFFYPNELFPLKKYKFEDTQFLGPANAEVFLARSYNHYLQLPPKDKRLPHYSDVTFL